jgi:hypothetical protein
MDQRTASETGSRSQNPLTILPVAGKAEPFPFEELSTDGDLPGICGRGQLRHHRCRAEDSGDCRDCDHTLACH